MVYNLRNTFISGGRGFWEKTSCILVFMFETVNITKEFKIPLTACCLQNKEFVLFVYN